MIVKSFQQQECLFFYKLHLKKTIKKAQQVFTTFFEIIKRQFHKGALKRFKNLNCVLLLSIQCKSESCFIGVNFSQPAFVTAAPFCQTSNKRPFPGFVTRPNNTLTVLECVSFGTAQPDQSFPKMWDTKKMVRQTLSLR